MKTNIQIRLNPNQMKFVEKMKQSPMYSSRAECIRIMIDCYIKNDTAMKNTANVKDIKDLF